MSQTVPAATPSELPDTIAGLLSRMLKELQCPICIQPITKATSTPCGHTFCRQCIQRWLQQCQGVTCPCCNYKLHRRLLYESESIDRLVTEFGKLREAYEQETHEDLSLVVPEQHEMDWRQEPEPNLSLQYPYPTKQQRDTSSSFQSGQEQSATCDSEVTHVTSLEIRQAQETHARFDAISTATDQEQRKTMASSIVSLDSPVIAVSRITDVRVLQIIPSLFRQMNAKRLTLVTQEITFVLVSTDKNRLAQCATMYLQAILLGKPVVSTQWVLDCHDQNEILPVEPYLVVGDTSKGANQAPQRVRELLAKGQPRLFEGQAFYLDGEFRNPSKEELMSLITLGGGRVVASHDASVQIICPDDKDTLEQEAATSWQGGPISKWWIIDCISAYKVLDRKLYHVA
ncbi:hypothetical protein K492DRAFT_206963 [Lichtheimia hyalospora FSU 10163]|nr:hypothetical protein K492DRAFT_206963 [Lichtheimia hyalospora FSU 10163]